MMLEKGRHVQRMKKVGGDKGRTSLAAAGSE